MCLCYRACLNRKTLIAQTTEFPFKRTMHPVANAEQGGNNLNGCKAFRAENGSSQGQNLALTGLFVRSLLDSGQAHNLSSTIAYGPTSNPFQTFPLKGETPFLMQESSILNLNPEP